METDGSNKSFLGNGLIIVLLKNTTQQMHIKMTWEKFGDIILMFLSIDRKYPETQTLYTNILSLEGDVQSCTALAFVKKTVTCSWKVLLFLNKDIIILGSPLSWVITQMTPQSDSSRRWKIPEYQESHKDFAVVV